MQLPIWLSFLFFSQKVNFHKRDFDLTGLVWTRFYGIWFQSWFLMSHCIKKYSTRTENTVYFFTKQAYQVSFCIKCVCRYVVPGQWNIFLCLMLSNVMLIQSSLLLWSLWCLFSRNTQLKIKPIELDDRQQEPSSSTYQVLGSQLSGENI